MEKNLKKEFEKMVYLPLRREITLSGILFILIGMGILMSEYLTNVKLTAPGIIFIIMGIIFFFRRYVFDRGFASKGDPTNRFNLNLALQERLRRFKLLQEIHYSFKRARKITLINKWLEES